MDTPPTLPTNPQPIDYEIEKFVEWKIKDGDIATIWFCGKPWPIDWKRVDNGPSNWTQRVVDLIYADARIIVQTFSDLLAQKPIEVEPLEWPQPQFGAGYFFVEPEFDTWLACWRPEGGDASWVYECDCEEDAKLACQEKCLEWLSAQLGRPVVVKKEVRNG